MLPDSDGRSPLQVAQRHLGRRSTVGLNRLALLAVDARLAAHAAGGSKATQRRRARAATRQAVQDEASRVFGQKICPLLLKLLLDFLTALGEAALADVRAD